MIAKGHCDVVSCTITPDAIARVLVAGFVRVRASETDGICVADLCALFSVCAASMPKEVMEL